MNAATAAEIPDRKGAPDRTAIPGRRDTPDRITKTEWITAGIVKDGTDGKIITEGVTAAAGDKKARYCVDTEEFIC